MRQSSVRYVFLWLFLHLSCAAHAQDNGQRLLHRAVQCLVVKNFLPAAKVEAGAFSYLLDAKSYPGRKMFYVVNYPNRLSSDGLAFTLFLNEDNGRQVFNVQNNARFTLTKNADEGVSFDTPPLGGAWTRSHLTFAIKKMEKQARLTIMAKDVLAIDPSIACEAYTDPEPANRG